MPGQTPYLVPAWRDDAVPPGEDFYAYANGGWLADNPVPPEYPAWGAFSEIRARNEDLLEELLAAAADADDPADDVTAMVGDYVAAGMDTGAIDAAGLGPLRGLLETIDAMTTAEQLRDVVAGLHAVGVGALFDVAVQPDFDHTDRYLLYVGQGGLGLPERDYYLRDDDRSVALREAYREHVGVQLANLGPAVEEATAAAADVVEFETRLASSSYTAEQLRDLDLTVNRTAVEELDGLMPGFGPRGYLSARGVSPDAVNVDNPGFLRDLDALLRDTDVATLRHYLRWHVVREFAPALPPAFEDAAFEFYGRVLGGQQEQRARWKRILTAATEDIGEQVARLFVDAAFSQASKDRCEEMVTELVAAMERSVREADWMTDETREAALTKVSTFTYKIGYPDRWRDYSGLSITPDSFVGNRMRAAAFEIDRRLSRLDDPVDATEWEMPAHVVNAYYNPLRNEIVFPAGILQPPMFWADADDAGNYGAIGAIIGHEITHGFDDQGSRFDEHGRYRMWWSDQDRDEFERRATQLADQVDAYPIGEGLSVNGRLTLGENIADLGGLAISHDAWRHAGGADAPEVDGFSAEQRFFLSFATIFRANYSEQYLQLMLNVDVHSPGPVRVNSPVSNTAAFADAFGLAQDAPLRRPDEDRVEIW